MTGVTYTKAESGVVIRASASGTSPALTVGDSAPFTLEEQRRFETLPGVRHASFSRSQSLLLDPHRPRVTLIARTLDDPSRLPQVGRFAPVVSGNLPAIWATEAMFDVYGFAPGRTVVVPLAGRPVEFIVAGLWRDYARQQGALLIDRGLYITLTGDRDANEAALALDPGASVDEVYRG